MDKKILTFVAAGLVAAGVAAFVLMGGSNALKGEGGSKGTRSVTASIGSFDPNADVTLDLDKYGSERPDDYGVQQAFNNQFGALDECVMAEKERRHSDKQLKGDVVVEVLLNPLKEETPKVNATMPKSLAKSTELTECVREAAANADYPKYDGPPVVAKFEFELDPGYTEE